MLRYVDSAVESAYVIKRCCKIFDIFQLSESQIFIFNNQNKTFLLVAALSSYKKLLQAFWRPSPTF